MLKRALLLASLAVASTACGQASTDRAVNEPSTSAAPTATATTSAATTATASTATVGTATVGTVAASTSRPAAPVTTAPAPSEVAAPDGTYPVATLTLPLVDTSRPTSYYGQILAPWRALTTMVWYPKAGGGPFPLIVFAHGYQVGLTPYLRICQQWASAGYVVAAPEFPLTDEAVAGAHLDEHDMVNQPTDVSFVITAMLKLGEASSGSPLSGLVQDTKIAVAGHSDGADTALAVGYVPTVDDPRIHAVIADAPDPITGISASNPLRSTLPLLLVHGTADTIAPFQSSVTVTGQLRTPGWFLQLLGANHLPPIEGPSAWTPVFDTTTTDFFNIELKGAPGSTLDSAVGSSALARLIPLSAS